ncbi:MAG: magnesium transporter [Bacteriovoracaceae bacterium]
MNTFEIQEPDFSLEDTINQWPSLNPEQRREKFLELNREQAEDVFLNLSSAYQSEIYTSLIPEYQKRTWLRLLDPDDVADLLQELPEEDRGSQLDLLEHTTRAEVFALMAYKEDEAGGLMNTRFARLRPEMTVEEAIKYLRAQAQGHLETIYYGYVLDREQKLLGVTSLRQLFLTPQNKRVSEIMQSEMVHVQQETPQEEIANLFTIHNLIAIPVVDENMIMKGIVTVDDIVSVYQEEATEDIQKIGGMGPLEEPYLDANFLHLIRKRAGWLLILFVSEMFTASAMAVYEKSIAKAVVLALFIPLVISSGGNSGSQATTLIIRAIALGEVRLRDWWRVFVRELGSGLVLGLILGGVGYLRIMLWPGRDALYGPHSVMVAVTVSLSLIGIVLWGTLVGSMLPFLLKKLKLDPATASAPFVATLVDVTGIVIYFSMANIFLSEMLN